MSLLRGVVSIFSGSSQPAPIALPKSFEAAKKANKSDNPTQTPYNPVTKMLLDLSTSEANSDEWIKYFEATRTNIKSSAPQTPPTMPRTLASDADGDGLVVVPEINADNKAPTVADVKTVATAPVKSQVSPSSHSKLMNGQLLELIGKTEAEIKAFREKNYSLVNKAFDAEQKAISNKVAPNDLLALCLYGSDYAVKCKFMLNQFNKVIAEWRISKEALQEFAAKFVSAELTDEGKTIVDREIFAASRDSFNALLELLRTVNPDLARLDNIFITNNVAFKPSITPHNDIVSDSQPDAPQPPHLKQHKSR